MGFVFNILRPFDMALAVTESLVMNIAGQVLTFLGLIGGYRGSDHGGNGRQNGNGLSGTLGRFEKVNKRRRCRHAALLLRRQGFFHFWRIF